MRPTKPKSKSKYQVRFTYNGIQRIIVLDKDKSLSEYMCSNIDRIIKYRQAGMPLMPDLLGFLNNNSTIRKKLIEWEILEADQDTKQTIKELSKQHISEKIHVSEKRKKELAYPIKNLVNYCNAIYLDDLSLKKVEGYLYSLIDSGLSARTYNKHLQIIKQLTTWIDVRGYGILDLRGIKKLNEDRDKRYKRRPLTDFQAKALLKNMHGKHHGLTCEERRIVYLFGLELGFRWNEIVTLSVGDIDLEKKTASIKPENEKAGRGTTKALPSFFYNMLEKYIKSSLRLPTCRLFENMWQQRGADMIHRDLDEANIDWREDSNDEVLDFHALRHTFGTRHARAGASPAQLKNLMRHTDINLTMKYYVHLTVEDERTIVDALPSLYG